MYLRFYPAEINAIPGYHLQDKHRTVPFITFRFKSQRFITGGHKILDFAFFWFERRPKRIKYPDLQFALRVVYSTPFIRATFRER